MRSRVLGKFVRNVLQLCVSNVSRTPEESHPSRPHCAALVRNQIFSCFLESICFYIYITCRTAHRSIMSSSQRISVELPPETAAAPVNTHSSSPITSDKMATVAMPRMSPELSLQTSFNASHSPPHSPSSPASRRPSRSPLSLDLSSVPGLSSPAPPTNTLIITRLEDPKIFHPASLATIREHISSIAPLNSFSPLKSMCRLIVSFETEADAIKVRQEIDRTAFTPTNICKCYFGEPTPIGDTMKFLERPDAGRLFFISPPPSPPVGWESKAEDPPNKQVHADDLAAKLSNLTGKMVSEPAEMEEQVTAEELKAIKASPTATSPHRRAWGSMASITDIDSPIKMRSRSSTLIYDPKEHGESPGLPAVVVETEDDSEVELDDEAKSPMAHTMRPPVELIE